MATRFRRLLLATEHGEFDVGAEALAFELARRCELPLVAVLPLASNPEFEAVAPQAAARSDDAGAVRRVALEAAARAAAVDLRLRVRHGAQLDAEIVEEAREQRTELIVIRRRGRRSLLANLLVGEMVGRVVADAPCSVLIVPRSAQMWSRGVLVGIDPLRPDPSLLEAAAMVARDCDVPLRVACVVGSEAARARATSVLQGLLEQARRHAVAATGELRSGRTEDELLAAVRACDADLLVVGRSRGASIARIWPGDTARKVAGLSECPVLVHVPASPTESDPP